MAVKRHKLTEILQKLETYMEDILIAFLAIISVIIILLSIVVIGNGDVLAVALFGYSEPKIAMVLGLTFAGYLIFPWLVTLALLLLAREYWIVRRVLERAVRFEVSLEKEIEEVVEEESKKSRKTSRKK